MRIGNQAPAMTVHDATLIRAVLERSGYSIVGRYDVHRYIALHQFMWLFNPTTSVAVMEACAEEVLGKIDNIEAGSRARQPNNAVDPTVRYQFSAETEAVRGSTDPISNRDKVLHKIFARALEQSGPDLLVDFLDTSPNQQSSYLTEAYITVCYIGANILREEAMRSVLQVAAGVLAGAAVMTVMPYVFTGAAILVGKVAPLCAAMLSPSILTALGQVGALFASITIEEVLAVWVISLLGMMFNERVLHIPYLNAAVAGFNTALSLCVWDLVTPTIIFAEGIAVGVKSFTSVERLATFCIAEVRGIQERETEAKRRRISQEWQRLIDTYAPGQAEGAPPEIPAIDGDPDAAAALEQEEGALREFVAIDDDLDAATQAVICALLQDEELG